MFYLSNGCLEKLMQKKSIFAKAAGTDLLVSTIRLFDTKKSTLVVEVCDILQVENEFYGLKLYDGSTTLPVLIDAEQVSVSNAISDEHHMRNGSVITISKIALMKKSEFKFLADTSKGENETIVLIKEYCLVGHNETPHEEQDDSDEDESEQDKDDSGIQATEDKTISTNTSSKRQELASHTINSLVPRDSNNSWTITCLLCKKSIVRQFTNRLTSKTNALIRLQFCDESGYIEVVGFDDNIEKLQTLCINSTYDICNGDIKSSPKNYRSWQEQENNSNFDIVINQNTKITLNDHVKVTEPNTIQREEAKSTLTSVEAAAEYSGGEETTTTMTTTMTMTRPQTSNSSRHNTKGFTRAQVATRKDSSTVYKKVNELINMPVESFVNVFGIVESVKEAKMLEKKTSSSKPPLTMRNFTLIDDTKVFISVALWGTQAEECALKAGNIVLLNNVKTTNYGGLSLSVMRCSELTLIPDSYLAKLNASSSQEQSGAAHQTRAQILKDWWNTWYKSRNGHISINSLLSKKRLVDRQEFDQVQTSKKKRMD